MRCLLLTVAIVLGCTPRGLAQIYRFEAENGILDGTSIASSRPGFSGTGYVNFDSGNSLSVQVNVPDGLYELWIGYNAPFGHKGYGVRVDSEIGNGVFDSTGNLFRQDRAGLFNLTGTTNTLRIDRDWGYYNVDYFELRPGAVHPPASVAQALADPLATQNTQFLMNFMTSIYGSKTLSGQQGQVGQAGAFPSTAYLSESGNLVPAVRGSDFMDYSPSRLAFGANPNGETERVVNWARQTGGIPTMMWHWNAPTDLINQPGKEWWRGFYTNATTFDLQAALASPSSERYQLLLRDIDAIAVELKKFRDAGVPVLWRPLHEAQGNSPPNGRNPDGTSAAWFWWGASGPQAFKDLWRLMHDRLTDHHGLHNLIWTFTSSDAVETHLDWYPGDDVVDIVGVDVYTNASSSMSGQWLNMLDVYDGRKMIALSESGTLPNATLLNQRGIEWSWFSPWSVTDVVNNYTPAQLQALLGHADILTLNELPAMPWKLSAPMPGDYNDDGLVDAGDYIVWRKSLGQAGIGLPADSNFDGRIDDVDYEFWISRFGQTAGAGGTISPANVPEPANLRLAGLAMSFLFFLRRYERPAAILRGVHPSQ